MNGKKITVIGGGHGTSVVLSALAGAGAHLSGVLAMADDGGSTGKLREELGTSAVGDIRQCLAALATKKDIAQLFAYRFEKGGLSGHSLGNLFLAAGEQRTGSLEKSIELAKKTLGVEVDILPSTDDKPQLVLNREGKTVKGVYTIANTDLRGTPKLSLQPKARLSRSAAKAISGADFVIVAPGNFYCSIMPALLVDGMAEAIKKSRAKVILICNLVNRAGHTGGFSVEDYADELSRLAGDIGLDAIVYNTAEIAPQCLRAGEQPVRAVAAKTDYKMYGREIADGHKVENGGSDKIAAVRSLVRHDKRKLATALVKITEEL